jgi:hypothetical protein
MSVPLWVIETAERFWAAAGEPPPYPRDLGLAMLLALPLARVELPGLCVSAVDDYLARRDLPWRTGTADRPLRACLVARGGHGYVFLEASDPPEEQRFSLAHEIAHYLLDHAEPRARAAARLGAAALEVLDGRRPPTRAERVHAVLARVALDLRVHLLDRTPQGYPTSDRASAAERRADRLAFELLAPHDAVLAALDDAAADLITVLTTRFGLPPDEAAAYAEYLRPTLPQHPVLRQLGLA